ncbi:MAG: PIN domain-containing protein [Propionibacteriaceae bacterium]|jgi:predicted nucleic acid-binding protein|nr:PIN domain-containing protein [Propionibacteriaceae bacterium]
MVVDDEYTVGLLDTSVFIAQESGRGLETASLPERSLVSVITAAEIEAGIHTASNVEIRAQRLLTYQSLMRLELLPVDRQATHQWAKLRVAVAQAGRRANINDMWIAAIALARKIPVITQDDDFDVLASVSELQVVKV